MSINVTKNGAVFTFAAAQNSFFSCMGRVEAELGMGSAKDPDGEFIAFPMQIQ